jgi:hypothetical protein
MNCGVIVFILNLGDPMKMILSSLALSVIGLALSISASAQNENSLEKKDEGAGAVKSAHVSFVEPKNGATVPKTFTAKFAVEGMKVAPAGPVEMGTGHFHLMIDAPAVKEGMVIPADAQHVHFGKGQTEDKLTLTPGKHTLVLQFADGAHKAYNSSLTDTITVNVK